MFRINPQSGVPIYQQLMEQIRRMISSGQLKAGDTLPSVRNLSLSHTVNTMTISKAYNKLEAEGWLERPRGKPMTVSTLQPLTENKIERLKRLNVVIDQVAIAAQQLELNTEDVLKAMRKTMEKPND